MHTEIMDTDTHEGSLALGLWNAFLIMAPIYAVLGVVLSAVM